MVVILQSSILWMNIFHITAARFPSSVTPPVGWVVFLFKFNKEVSLKFKTILPKCPVRILIKYE
jgi:hypothetical protein